MYHQKNRFMTLCSIGLLLMMNCLLIARSAAAELPKDSNAAQTATDRSLFPKAYGVLASEHLMRPVDMSNWPVKIDRSRQLFVDDYLNSLAVGSAMRDLTDKYRISREKLATWSIPLQLPSV